MFRDIYTIVGERVRRERLRAKLTIERLAELAGISPSFLAYIETNGRKASLATVQKLAEALRLPIAELFKDAPAPDKDSAHDAAQQFIHIIQDQKDEELDAILDAVKAISKVVGKKKRT